MRDLDAAGAELSPVRALDGSNRDPLARAYEMPCTLVLEVPAVQFSVGDLMRLQPGSIVKTSAQQNEDLALHVNGQLVGVVELDVVSDRLAVRILGMA